MAEWNGPPAGDSIMADVLAMLDALNRDKLHGPAVMYLPDDGIVAMGGNPNDYPEIEGCPGCSSGGDKIMQGLGQPIGTLSGSYLGGVDWSAQTDFTVTIDVKRIVKHIGHLYIEFEGTMLGRTETFKMFSALDRRQARRVARKLGRRFNWRGGVARWRS